MPSLIKTLRDKSRLIASTYYLLKHRDIDLRHDAIRGFCRDPLNSPLLNCDDSAPLNRQVKRRECVEKLLAEFLPQTIVETGTFLGTSTLFLAANAPDGCPVHTVELDDLYYRFSAKRFQRQGVDIQIHHMSSEALLGETRFDVERLFVYLDAHWYDYLPIREEILALKDYSQIIIGIDDFEVPGEPAWGFDNYRRRGVLTWSYIQNEAKDFAVFYPAYTPEEDNGAKRGFCILAKGDKAIGSCEKSGLLKRAL